MKSESVMQVYSRKARGPENLLRRDTVSFKEVTKEGRDVSELGSREVLVARDVLHVHALQVRSRWRTETKRHRVDLIRGVSILISLGGQTGRLENILWLDGTGCDHVYTCPSRHLQPDES